MGVAEMQLDRSLVLRLGSRSRVGHCLRARATWPCALQGCKAGSFILLFLLFSGIHFTAAPWHKRCVFVGKVMWHMNKPGFQ
jgi:hypothetical protein